MVQITQPFNEPFSLNTTSLPSWFSPSVIGLNGRPYLIDTESGLYRRNGIEVVQQRTQAVRVVCAGVRQHLVGHDNEGIAGEQGQGLPIGLVHGGASTTQVSVVKGGHVIVHQ